MDALISIDTERLLLRGRRRDDLAAILNMDLDPDVYRYSDLRSNFDMKAPDRVTLRKKLRSEIMSGTPRNFWVIEWKDRPAFLGLAGLKSEPPPIKGLPIPEGTNFLIFRLAKVSWGQGIATEAARAILEHGFRVLKCPMIAAFSHRDNKRSSRVLDKIGLNRRGEVVVPYLSGPTINGVPQLSDKYNFHQLSEEEYVLCVDR